MIADLQDEKSQLKELVRLAMSGEDVVITEGGSPVAILTACRSEEVDLEARKRWVEELQAHTKEFLVGEPSNTPQSFWDELRADYWEKRPGDS